MPNWFSIFFQGLAEGCLRNYALRVRTVHLPPGDTLIHSGSLLSSFYYVEHGSLEVLDPFDGAILAVLGVGDFFGGLPPLVSTSKSTQSRETGGRSTGRLDDYRRLVQEVVNTSMKMGSVAFEGMDPRLPVPSKSRFNVRALTYCDLHFVERSELASLLVVYPELAENFVEHLELTIPLAGSGRFISEAVSCIHIIFFRCF